MIKDFVAGFIMTLKKILYFFYSNNKQTSGRFISHQPVVMRGKGQVVFGDQVSFGVVNSPQFHSTYAYIEARSKNASITFGNNVSINNSFSIVAEHKITIKDDVLIGYNVSICDSNFHDLDIHNRKETDPDPKEVFIASNVFIGNNVTILKGVKLGKNCVVATGSIVTKSFPENVVVGGNPAKIIRNLTFVG